MPVMYVAIGRRLGYPMRLVAAKEHMFCRWDDGKERFNIEGAGNGDDYPPDDYYRTWPKLLTDADMASGLSHGHVAGGGTGGLPAPSWHVPASKRAAAGSKGGLWRGPRAPASRRQRIHSIPVVCGGGSPRPMSAQNPAAEAWLQGPSRLTPMTPHPDTDARVNLMFGIPNQQVPVPGITRSAMMKNRTNKKMLAAVFVSLGVPNGVGLLQPALGRFLSRDPISEPEPGSFGPGGNRVDSCAQSVHGKDGPNSYEFVENDPANRIDKLGLQSAMPPTGLPPCKLNGQLVVSLMEVL